MIIEDELRILSGCGSWYGIRHNTNEPLVLMPEKQLIPSDRTYKAGSGDLSDSARTCFCFNSQVFGTTPQAPSQRGGAPTAVLGARNECQAKSDAPHVICLYTITPVIRIDWDRKPSGCAEIPDKLIFV
jgi:hypothetical protein